ALSAASAVSQEKDRRTFVLLLLTRMNDYEIVLGKLLGALLPIAVQVLATAPVLAMLLLLGGIDPEQVLQAVLVLGAAAFAAGSRGARCSTASASGSCASGTRAASRSSSGRRPTRSRRTRRSSRRSGRRRTPPRARPARCGRTRSCGARSARSPTAAGRCS